MFTNLFGAYLVQKGIISTEQFESIRAEQAKTRVKLGLIAVAEKLMTQEQADAVNEKQSTMDRRFGDIAIEMGYLNKAQVKNLLTLQGNPYIQFTQAAVDLNIMSLEQIESSVLDFQKEKGFTNMDVDAVKSGDIDRIIPLYLPEELPWNTAEFIAVMLRTLTRLVSSDILIRDAYIVKSYKTNEYAMQSMEGDLLASTAISGSQEGILAIAQGFAKDLFDSIGPESLDSVGEFINIVDGLFATSISHDMVEVSLKPPMLSELGTTMEADELCIMPVEVDGYPVDIIVSLDSNITIH